MERGVIDKTSGLALTHSAAAMPPPMVQPPRLSDHRHWDFFHASSVANESLAQDWQQLQQAMAAAAAATQSNCSFGHPATDRRFSGSLAAPGSPRSSAAAAAAVATYSGAAGPSYLLPKRKNATRETTSVLKAWLNEHRKNPYPTKGEKVMLALVTAMSLTQVSTWFANARRRLKKENRMTWTPKVGSRDCVDAEAEDSEEFDQDGDETGEFKDVDDQANFGSHHKSRKLRFNDSFNLDEDDEAGRVKRRRFDDMPPPLQLPPPPPPPPPQAQKPRIWSIVETVNRVDPPRPPVPLMPPALHYPHRAMLLKSPTNAGHSSSTSFSYS